MQLNEILNEYVQSLWLANRQPINIYNHSVNVVKFSLSTDSVCAHKILICLFLNPHFYNNDGL